MSCGDNCGQCGEPCETSPEEVKDDIAAAAAAAAPEDPDTASPPRPQQKTPFQPNNPDEFFKYEEGEYQLAIERLRRYAEDWPDKQDALTEAVAAVDPEKDGSLNKLISETSSVVQAILMQQWAHEVMKQTEKDGEQDDVAVDENGHKVNEQECPYLLWNLAFIRHSLAKTLIDSTRQGANAADLTGVVNNEALSAMSTFIDDFVHIAPSLRKVDLGNKDPLKNTL